MSALISARIKFKKKGSLKYISHLDLNRCMARAMRRAGTPLWYTQGFNPHPYMTFALPLSLGFESECEFMDIKLEIEDGFCLEKIKKNLAAQMPPGLEIVEITQPKMKIGDIGFAEYAIRLETGLDKESVLREAVASLRGRRNLTIVKKSKSGEREVDVSDYIRSAEYSIQGNTVVIRALLPAGSGLSINPGCFPEVFRKYSSVPVEGGSITRLCIYNEQKEAFA